MEMSRITKDIGKNEYIPMYSENYNIRSVFDKLGKLEDLEQELGIDLVTLFNLFDKELYLLNDNNCIESAIVDSVSRRYIYLILHHSYIDCFDYKELNKTIFFTKEEAENNLKEMERE